MARTPWKKKRDYFKRRVETKDKRQRFLIVCEGKKTEPNYFRSFRVPKEVEVVIGFGNGVHVTVVREAIRLRDASRNDFDQVWAVFDRDKELSNPRSVQNFNEALRLAQENNIQTAYSNDAFELWYLLHFDYCDTAILRSDYITKLQSKLPGGYKKNDPYVYAKLASLMDDACRNAMNLLSRYEPSNPESDDPSTTVHLLVQELRRFVAE